MKNFNVSTRLVSRFSNEEKTVEHYFESATRKPVDENGSNVAIEYDEFWGVMNQYSDSWTICESTIIYELVTVDASDYEIEALPYEEKTMWGEYKNDYAYDDRIEFWTGTEPHPITKETCSTFECYRVIRKLDTAQLID